MRRMTYSESALARARQFIECDVDYTFTDLEELVLKSFFTNLNKKIFFVHTLPETIIDTLLAMYSRMKNPRGLRGTFVDQLLPQLLIEGVLEEGDSITTEQYMKQYGICNLETFANHMASAEVLTRNFASRYPFDAQFIRKMTSAKRIKRFLSMWLDKYGHNSIARMAVVHFCCEDVSMLAAKTMEWSRPASGIIELSSRYVTMSAKGVFPIADIIEEYDQGLAIWAREWNERLFEEYRRFDGTEIQAGILRKFLLTYWDRLVTSGEITAEQLQASVSTELCDVLGNFLPAGTLTSVGISISGEAFPNIIRHLRLDNTPESLAIADFLIEEGGKLGYDQFLRHLDLATWDIAQWGYLRDNLTDTELSDFRMPNRRFIEQTILDAYNESAEVNFGSLDSLLRWVKSIPRGTYDKLPSEFESVTLNYRGLMSFRGWRDLQRMSFSAHKRGRLTGSYGFYRYDKPAPLELHQAFECVGREAASTSGLRALPIEIREYVMPLGILVPYSFRGNIRHFEFCGFQRGKPDVNHEVRQEFLKMEALVRQHLPWWSQVSRANTTPAFVFARGKAIPLLETV